MKRVKTILFVMALLVLVPYVPAANACCEWTVRDDRYWQTMYGEPKVNLFNSEPISLLPSAGSPYSLNEEGIKAFKATKYRLAKNHFSEAIEINTSLAPLYHNLALVFYSTLGLEKAAELWKTAIALEPENLRYRYHLASALGHNGNVEEAIKQYQHLDGKMNNRPEIYNSLGQLFEFKGDVTQAEINYEKAISIKPDYRAALNNLGRMYKKTERLVEAEGIYKKMMEIRPEDAENYIDLGNIYLEMDKKLLAIDYYRKAISLREDYPRPHILLSKVYREMGKMKEALEEERLASSLERGLRFDIIDYGAIELLAKEKK